MRILQNMKCVPYRDGETPVPEDEISELIPQIPDWVVIKINGIGHLKRQFEFSNFVQSLEFTNKIGCIAEEEKHHPAILTEWGRVTVEWWTHKIKGLHQNDFVMAAKTDELYAKSPD
jgi:4a-hydroxytetrahydrobiopterin dehydratase